MSGFGYVSLLSDCLFEFPFGEMRVPIQFSALRADIQPINQVLFLGSEKHRQVVRASEELILIGRGKKFPGLEK